MTTVTSRRTYRIGDRVQAAATEHYGRQIGTITHIDPASADIAVLWPVTGDLLCDERDLRPAAEHHWSGSASEITLLDAYGYAAIILLAHDDHPGLSTAIAALGYEPIATQALYTEWANADRAAGGDIDEHNGTVDALRDTAADAAWALTVHLAGGAL